MQTDNVREKQDATNNCESRLSFELIDEMAGHRFVDFHSSRLHYG